MLLNNKFYKLLSEEADGAKGTYHVAILPDCSVYEGHFPGDPVCPGVCNMETIKECAMRLLGCDTLRIKTIKQCRLTAIATPEVCPEVSVEVSATPIDDVQWTIQATISDDHQTYMQYKGVMSAE